MQGFWFSVQEQYIYLINISRIIGIFSKFIKSLIEKQIMIIPSFVIHDAMVFEILKDDYCKVAEHLNNIEIEQLNNTNFPLELEALHGN